MARPKKSNAIPLPPLKVEEGYPHGDGPLWVSDAIGAPGSLAWVKRYLSEDGEAISLILHFHNGVNLVIQPARKVTTRWLAETLGALGFPMPYYQPQELARLGQAIGRIADKIASEEREQQAESAAVEYAGVVAGWLTDSMSTDLGYVLHGRDGRDVRAAIEHVRKGYTHGSWTAPLIMEPSRDVLLAWSVPVRAAIRERFGTAHDHTVGMNLKRAGLERERVAARAVGAHKTTVELPVWVVPNGWQGVTVEIPDTNGESARSRLCVL